MDYTSFTLALPSGPLLFDPTSLYAALHTVPDHRQRRGVRYPLAPMLFIAILAKLLGHQHPRAIADFAKLHAAQLCAILQLERPTMPHHTTWSRWFKDAIYDQELQAACAPFFHQLNLKRQQRGTHEERGKITLEFLADY